MIIRNIILSLAAVSTLFACASAPIAPTVTPAATADAWKGKCTDVAEQPLVCRYTLESPRVSVFVHKNDTGKADVLSAAKSLYDKELALEAKDIDRIKPDENIEVSSLEVTRTPDGHDVAWFSYRDMARPTLQQRVYVIPSLDGSEPFIVYANWANMNAAAESVTDSFVAKLKISTDKS